MIAITMEEKKQIAALMPHVHIRRTVRQKTKRHKYYMEENRSAVRLLAELREENKNNE